MTIQEKAIEQLERISSHLAAIGEKEDYTDVAIQALEQTMWIPVSERLPKQYKEVIVTDIETSDTYLSWYIGNGCWECDNGLFKNRIIAWQPLPQRYEVEIEEKN